MANTTTSPNMSLPVPNVSQDSGPDWANNLNSCLSILDQHNHAPGSGVQISQSGISLTASVTSLDSLNFNTSNAYALRSARFTAQLSPLALATDIGCLYEAGVDLYYNDGAGNQIRLTSGGSIVGTAGSIGGLPSGTASATYSGGTFVWQSATSTAANMDAGSYIYRNSSASSKGLTLNPPNAMGVDYSLFLPTIPSGTSIMSLDNSGNMAAVYTVDNSTIIISSNIIQVGTISAANIPDGSITTAKLANLCVTAAKIANNTITTSQISNSAGITGTQIASATVTGSNIAASTITGSNIAASTITGSNIAATTVTASNIANATITTTQISNSAGITGTQIASATVTGSNIASTTITASKIANNTITTSQISNSAGITGTQIANTTVTRANLAAVGQQISSSSGSFTTSSTSYVDITNLTVSITVTGRPVVIAIIPDGTSNPSYVGINSSISSAISTIKIIRDSTDIGFRNIQFSLTGTTNPAMEGTMGLLTIDVPSAGTYTYKLQGIVSAGTTTLGVSFSKLFVYEL